MDKKELTREDVYRLVKDRKAYVVFRNLETDLELLSKNRNVMKDIRNKVDGKNIHDFTNLRLSIHSNFVVRRKNHFPIEETMAEYEQRDKVLFEQGIGYILNAVNNYGVKI